MFRNCFADYVRYGACLKTYSSMISLLPVDHSYKEFGRKHSYKYSDHLPCLEPIVAWLF